jgi:signal transduction histidine kinase/streptogramin lyase
VSLRNACRTLAACVPLLLPGPLVAATLATSVAAPVPEARPVIPLVHTRWLFKDGAPPNINGIAQTPDGWLWLASSVGLFRFDGVTFSRYRPPAGIDLPDAIERIGVLSDGTLWIAPRFGKLFFLRGETLQAFTERDGLPAGFILDVARDKQGHVWIASGPGLYRLNGAGRAWSEVGGQLGVPRGALVSLLADRGGTLWLLAPGGIHALEPGARQVRRVADQQGWGSLQQGPDGAIWASDMSTRRIRQVSPRPGDGRAERLLSGIELMKFAIDRRGNFWLPEYGGMGRLQRDGGAARLQGFTRQHGLSGEHGNAVFEDREGNVWAATTGGLDQFRAPRLGELTLPPYQSEGRPLAVGANGEFWIDHLYFAAAGARPRAFAPPSTEQTLVTTLYRDPHGILWAGAHDGLWRVQGTVRSRIPFPPALRETPFLTIFALGMDEQDGLWVSFGARGLWRWHEGVWTARGGIAGLADLGVTTVVAGPGRQVWFGATGDSFAILRDGKPTRYGRADGVKLGSVLQIVPHGPGAYLGGEGGVAYFDGKRTHGIQGSDGEQFPGTTGVVLTPAGELWANTAKGLFGIGASELARLRADPAYRPRYRRFDENDGLKGSAPPMLPLPSLVRTSNGELIASTGSGVFRLDPERLATNRLAPPVQVTAIAADGKAYAPTAGVRLPAAPDNVRIDYTALSLALPQRVRFRYLLEGVDHAWQDAGNRRAAFYTQLPPGQYTFRVAAANEDGVWNEAGARIAFQVPPTVFQTVWFKLLCGIAVALAAWALHRLRLRIALRRQTLAIEARVAERERIARDLHDTLLQSVQALIVAFKRVANRTPDDAATRPMMEQALAMATTVLVEGRDKVGGLRGEDAVGDLGKALRAYGEQLAEQYPPRFTLAIGGPVRKLRPLVYHELLAIGREALRNAFLHAGATAIGVELAYGERAFVLCVHDDGRGIEPEHRAGRAGHWGIPGMAERAAQAGAKLELHSAAGKGCTWRVQLPPHLAYAPDGTGAAWRAPAGRAATPGAEAGVSGPAEHATVFPQS